MTRKDYVALAEALNYAIAATSIGGLHPKALEAWRTSVGSIANVLAKDNPRFDRERFVKACQGERL